MTDHTEELLPCPFCSDVPCLPSGDGTQYEIECSCGMAISSVQICDLMTIDERESDQFVNYRYGEEFVERAKAQAIANWNRRATPAGHQRIAALEAESERLRAQHALSAENQRVVPAEPLLAATHPFEKPSLLKDCNVTYSNSSQSITNQEVRQEAVAYASPMPGIHPILAATWKALPDQQSLYPLPLYTNPQPGPDVRALVEALEHLDAMPRQSGHAYPSASLLRAESAVIRAAREVAAAHRQAQQGKQP